MRNAITFEKVETAEQWRELQLFAAEFNHKVNEKTVTPLISCRRAGKLFAYFTLIQFPIIAPSFHPGHTTSRDFVEVIEQVRAWAWLSTLGREHFPHGVAFAAFDRDPVIDRKLIEKMGFNDTGFELWQSTAEGL